MDLYADYCATIEKVYGKQFCPTREQWNAMCAAPRTTRQLTDQEFDDNQYAIENGDTEIFG